MTRQCPMMVLSLMIGLAEQQRGADGLGSSVPAAPKPGRQRRMAPQAQPHVEAPRVKQHYCLRTADGATSVVSGLGCCAVETRLPEELTECEYPQREFHFHGAAVRFHETYFSEAGYGATVWDSAIALSLLLAAPSRGGASALRGKSVLELGAGVGLAGLVAARHARRVVVSDVELAAGEDSFSGDRLLPRSTLDNIRRNMLLSEARGSVPRGILEASCLDWYAQAAVAQGKAVAAQQADQAAPATESPMRSAATCLADDERFDLLIGSDLVYYEEDIPHLVSTIVARLDEADGGLLFVLPGLTHERAEPVRKFVQQLREAARGLGGGEVKTTECTLRGYRAFPLLVVEYPGGT